MANQDRIGTREIFDKFSKFHRIVLRTTPDKKIKIELVLEPELDPMTVGRWPLSMVVVWIVNKDKAAVRMQRDVWLDASLVTLMDEDYKEPRTLWCITKSHREACAELWSKLNRGDIVARGQSNSSGLEMEIKCVLWNNLSPTQRTGKADVLTPINPAIDNRQWTAVTVSREEVLKLWPRADQQISAGKDTQKTGSNNKPKLELAKRAMAALWPEGVPVELASKARNRQICKWCKDNGHGAPPSPRTISTAIKNHRR